MKPGSDFFAVNQPKFDIEAVGILADKYINAFRKGEIGRIRDCVKNSFDKMNIDYVLDEETLERLLELAQGDVEKAFESDPAVGERATIIGVYPGFLAITLQRFAHDLDKKGIAEELTRGLTEWARRQTGIELHPGTKIGKRFFIDHGTGVVVGQTAQIGDDCTLFHGVTLGNKAVPNKGQRGMKRHPTLKNGVTVCAGAMVLGGDTIIGQNSTIGAGAIILKSLPENSLAFLSANGQLRVRTITRSNS